MILNLFFEFIFEFWIFCAKFYNHNQSKNYYKKTLIIKLLLIIKKNTKIIQLKKSHIMYKNIAIQKVYINIFNLRSIEPKKTKKPKSKIKQEKIYLEI